MSIDTEDPFAIEGVDIVDLEATEYAVGVDVKKGEGRLEFRNDGGVLCTFTGDPTQIYELAQRLMRAYDKLEGL